MTERHTLLPWQVNFYPGSCALGVGIEGAADTVVSVTCSSCQGDDPRLTEANAEFIVQACNAHDDLLAALKWAFSKARVEGPVLYSGDKNWYCYSCRGGPSLNKESIEHMATCPWDKARAAIAKAEQGEKP